MAALSPFRRAAAAAVAEALGVDASTLQVTTPPDASLGDLAVGTFPAAKALRAAPPALAAKAAAAVKPNELIEAATASGPYVNLKLRRGPVYAALLDVATGKAPTVPPTPGAGKTLCVDFSSPNIAKQLAYHHIRSTVIGHALVNLHRALGWKTVGINHLGDWGTTFGMLLSGIAKWGAPEPFSIENLNALYVKWRAAAKEDATLEDDARAWFKKLEDGDPSARAIWTRIRDVSLAEFDEAYRVLGVHFDEVRGESAYEAAMPGVIAMLEQKGLASVSEGALVVDLADLKIPPLLLRKADGATLYATRDLATALYRHETYDFARSLYVVAREQSLHFKQLFEVLKRAGFTWSERCEHVGFGLVRIGGKKSGTRSGNVVLLKEVLAEAQGKVAERLKAAETDLSAAEIAEVARDVGVGAVVFANLASARDKDVDFDLDEVTSFEGDAGPYVQYAHARTAGILRKGDVVDAGTLADVDLTKLVRDEEWALACKLTDTGDEVARAAEQCEPYLVARHLLDVCAAFSRWYTIGNQDPSLRVLTSDEPTRRARLALVAATRTVLKDGLALLGLRAPDRM